MKKYFVHAAFLLLPFLFAGCLRTYYPAGFHMSSHPVIYQSKSNKEAGYLGGDVSISQGNYKGESLYLIRGNYTYAVTWDHFNFNRRFFGYSGFYNVEGLEEYDGAKSVYGIGADLSLGPNIKINRLKIGLGLNVGVSGEVGEYYDFVRSAEREGAIDGYQNMVYVTVSAFPSISYEFSNTTVLSTQMNVGLPGFLSPLIVLNTKKHVYWLFWYPDQHNKENISGSRLVAGFMINIEELFNQSGK